MIRNTCSGSSIILSAQLKKLTTKRYQTNFAAGLNPFEEGNGTVRCIYEKWLNDPNAVGASWDSLFKGSFRNEYENPKFVPRHTRTVPPEKYEAHVGRSFQEKFNNNCFEHCTSEEVTDLQQILLVHRLIRSYQTRGHHLAKLDPLELYRVERPSKPLADEHLNLLRKVQYELDMNRIYPLPVGATHITGDNETALRLSEIITRLENVYCGRIGFEYTHINNYTQCDYLRKQFESPTALQMSKGQQRLLLARLARTIVFEEFFETYYPQTMRCSLAGCETLVPCIKTIIDYSTDVGVDHFIFGMTHRGRINILSNVFKIPLVQIMSLFNQLSSENMPIIEDNVFHLGVDTVKLNSMFNRKIRLTLLATPTHLESVNAVVLGRTKIEQMIRNEKNKVMSILVHGDMGFCGQGISYEMLNLSGLSAYNTGGIIHIVLNNQGTQTYSTDLGRIMNAPIFHVNADDAEAVQCVSKVAADWRNAFNTDCIVELIVSRNNTFDDFIIPNFYDTSKETRNVYDKYIHQLQNEDVIIGDEMFEYKDRYMDLLMTAYKETSKETHHYFSTWIDAPNLAAFNKGPSAIPASGIEESEIMSIGKAHACPPPRDFVVHKSIVKVLDRRAALLSQKFLNWSMAEALAFGSLLKDGVHVRLSGLDVEESSWANRHYVIHHQVRKGATYTPMKYLDPRQAKFSVHNTPLSQLAVLGFEIGYSQCDPDVLVVWETEDGDYANVAQVMLDEFLACGECKWGKSSGMVVNLPHGRNAVASNHVSCRPERYLQMCTDDPDVADLDHEKQLFDTNWIVVYPTTPANLFHVLRRQMLMPFRKALINILPKTLMTAEAPISPFKAIMPNTSFQRIITENKNPDKVRTVVFCCGKVYYEFAAIRERQRRDDSITFIRIEQVSPFPYDLLKFEVERYPNARFVFAQEEPKNMGFHHYCVPRLQNILRDVPLRVLTTPPVAHPSCGYPMKKMAIKGNYSVIDKEYQDRGDCLA